MAAFSYVALLHCARAQLYLLPKEVASLRCCSAVNRIKYSDFYHQSFCRSMSTYTDSEYIKNNSSGTVKSSDINSKEQPVNDGHNVHTTDSKRNETLETQDFHSTTLTAEGSKRQISTVKQTLIHSTRKKSKTVSQHLKQSWLNYYSSATNNTLDTGTNNYLQEDSQSKEKETSMYVKNRPGKTFGNLSMKINNKNERPDWRNPNERMDENLPEDIEEMRDQRLDIPLSRYGRQNKKSFYYTRKISIKGREGKIKEALAIFEHWMMVRDRVMPSKRTFVALIGILGRVGYTEKAFELFIKMKQLGLDPVDHIYTSLFNACANSPSAADGLKRTEYLLNHMKEKGVLPNLFTVKAAMKALAISGDFSRAFTLLDETSTRLKLDSECFNHLLIACISDKETGFRRALQVWQKMHQYRIRPDTVTFNLLIRSARDCDVGDLGIFCSAFDLDSLYFKMGENPGLLENINQNVDGKCDRGKPLSLSRPVLLTDNRKPFDVALEVIGKKINIHSSLSSEQSDPSTCSNAVLVHVSEPCKISSNRHVSEHEATHCRSISHGSRTSYMTADLYNFSENVSDTYLSASLPHAEKYIKNVSEWWEEKASDFSNSKISTPIAVSGRAKSGDSSTSLYSEILTQDTGNDLTECEVIPLSLKNLKFAFGRLALLGGAEKFISYMEAAGAQPDIKTFTQVLACLPNNEQSEFELLRMMEKRGMKPDIDFLNDIMMQRNLRKKNDSVKAVLKIVANLRLNPNMRTYAAMALTCLKEKEAHELLQDMKEANIEPNSVIMGHLIFISKSNFTYKLKMLKMMESLGLKVTWDNIAVIEKSIALTKKKIIEAENMETTSYYLSEPFQRSFQHFLRYYKIWLMKAELDKPRHPWDAFKHSPNPKQE